MEEKRSVGRVTTSATTGTVIAGAVTVLVVYVASVAGVEVPEAVSSALTVVLSAIGALVGGWLVKPGSGKYRAND